MRKELVYLLGVIIFQLLLIACFLLTQKKGKHLSNTILAVFFLAMAFSLSDGLVFILKGYQQYPVLAFWGSSGSFLVGSLLYFYTNSVVYKTYQLSKAQILHLTPFLLVFGFLLVSYHLQPLATKRIILQRREEGGATPAVVYLLLGYNYLQILIYIFFCFQEIGKYRPALREQFSSIKEKNLAWLCYMLSTFTIVSDY